MLSPKTYSYSQITSPFSFFTSMRYDLLLHYWTYYDIPTSARGVYISKKLLKATCIRAAFFISMTSFLSESGQQKISSFLFDILLRTVYRTQNISKI